MDVRSVLMEHCATLFCRGRVVKSPLHFVEISRDFPLMNRKREDVRSRAAVLSIFCRVVG